MHSFDVVLEVPTSFRWPAATDPASSVELSIVIEHAATQLARYDVTLSPIATPRSKVALCLKAIYHPFSEDTLARLTEWREHHALLGVEVVHWSARDPSYGAFVSAANRRSGRRDTFTLIPPLDPDAIWPVWEQHVMTTDCFARYRAATDWLGIWDLDEARDAVRPFGLG